MELITERSRIKDGGGTMGCGVRARAFGQRDNGSSKEKSVTLHALNLNKVSGEYGQQDHRQRHVDVCDECLSPKSLYNPADGSARFASRARRR
jgi:hypothetical protein